MIRVVPEKNDVEKRDEKYMKYQGSKLSTIIPFIEN